MTTRTHGGSAEGTSTRVIRLNPHRMADKSQPRKLHQRATMRGKRGIRK